MSQKNSIILSENFQKFLTKVNYSIENIPSNEEIIAPSNEFGYLGSYIDHTLLSPSATKSQIEKLCQEAIQYKFKAVCVNPSQLETVNHYLKKNSNEHKVEIATVIGFPLGQNLSQTKIEETKQSINIGVQEIDIVLNIGKLVEEEFNYVIEELKAMVDIAKHSNVLVKVIIESGLLRRDFSEQKIREACYCCLLAGVDYVKTSTGFLGTGATIEDVSLMHSIVGPFGVRVKASGGVGTSDDARKMISAGASRIGASKGISIVTESKTTSSSSY